MRVLHVTRDFPPRINGGLSTAVGGLVRASREQVAASVISFDGWRPSRRGGSAVETVADDGTPTFRLSDAAHLGEARRFAERQRPDVVHVHHAMLWSFAALVQRPSVYTVHVPEAHLRRIRGLPAATASERAEAVALSEASCVTAPSAAVAKDIADDMPSASGGALVLPLGVDAVADPPAGDPDPARALYVGRFGDVKGTRELLSVAAQSSMVWSIVGGLPDSPKADRRWRRRFAEAAPHAELCGWQSPDAVAACYRRASFVVVPSWYETFGQVIVEAMQHGVPAIASHAGGLAELPALHVPPRDEAALLAAIEELGRDPVARARAREMALREAPAWRWPRRIGPWISIYRKLT